MYFPWYSTVILDSGFKVAALVLPNLQSSLHVDWSVECYGKSLRYVVTTSSCFLNAQATLHTLAHPNKKELS